MKKKFLQPVCIALLLLLSFEECHADDTIVLQLKWRHQFQFAGYYAAIEKGFYREEGLNVEPRESNPGLNVVEEVVSGNADYGIAGSELIIYRALGKPVIVVAAVFQKSADIILTKKSSGISTPQAAAAEPIMISPRVIDGASIRAMFLKEGISPENLKYLDHVWSVDALISDKTKVFTAYITDQPYLLKKKNIPYFIIQPQDYGVDFYGDSLFTTSHELKENPGRLAKFRKATLKGWKYALDNSEEIVELILEKYSSAQKTPDRDHLLFEAEETKKLVFAEIVTIGHLNPGRWRHIGKTYRQLGFTDTQVDLDQFLYDPNPSVRLSDYYWIVAASLGIVAFLGVIAFVLFRLNKRLQREIDEHQKTSKLLNEIYYNADAGFFVVDVIEEKKFVYAGANPFHLKSIGNVPLERIVGKTPDELTDFFPAIPTELVEEVYALCVQKKVPIIRENPVKIGDEMTWWMSIISPIIDENNRVCRLIGTSLPITELKKAQEQTARAALEWQTTFDSTNDTIWILDKEQRIIRSNKTAEVMFDLSQEDMVGKHCWEVLHGTDEPILDCPVPDLKQSPARHTAEMQISGKWFQVTTDPVLEDEGSFQGFVHIISDISERKNTEEFLKESEKRYRTVVESVNEGIILQKATGEILTWNKSAKEIFGITTEDEDAMGQTFPETKWVTIHEDGNDFEDKDHPSKITLKTGRAVKGTIMGIKRSNGDIKWIEISTSPLYADDPESPSAVVISFTDITSRKLAEEALKKREKDLQLTLDSTTDGIWTWDVTSDEVFFSHKFYTMLGYAPGEFPALNESWTNLLHPEDREATLELVNRNLFVEKQGYDIEFRLKTKEGDYLWIRAKAKIADWDETGAPSYVIGNHENITSRKAAEAQIKANLNEKEILLQEIHHRVKNNMQVVASLLNLQSRKVDDITVKEALRESQNRIYAMSTVHELLHESQDLSQISLRPFLNKIVNSLVQSYAVNQGRIQLKTEVADVSIGIYQASPLCLTINELVSNSMKYAFPDHDEGEITISLVQKEDGTIKLIIADNGVGLPEGLDWRKPDTLGLHLVQVLVEHQLDGSVVLDSSHGTKFTIEFRLT